VRDGLAVGQFSFTAFDIDMDPLMIAGGYGKFIDHIPVNFDPFTDAGFFARQCLMIDHTLETLRTYLEGNFEDRAIVADADEAIPNTIRNLSASIIGITTRFRTRC
jgi:hypothetical protein